jgi:hypothetical protein
MTCSQSETAGTILTDGWFAMHGCCGLIKEPVDEDELLVEVRSVLQAAGV